jgi:hypothetical protein
MDHGHGINTEEATVAAAIAFHVGTTYGSSFKPYSYAALTPKWLVCIEMRVQRLNDVFRTKASCHILSQAHITTPLDMPSTPSILTILTNIPDPLIFAVLSSLKGPTCNEHCYNIANLHYL